MTEKIVKEDPKITYVKITIGYDKNKEGGPRYYCKGTGESLGKAIADLLAYKRAIILTPEHRKAIKKDLTDAKSVV